MFVYFKNNKYSSIIYYTRISSAALHYVKLPYSGAKFKGVRDLEMNHYSSSFFVIITVLLK